MPPVGRGQAAAAAPGAAALHRGDGQLGRGGGRPRPSPRWRATAGANEVYELFWRYGARDFRDIGHKAIYAANSYRTLQTIGWRHAEPVRALAGLRPARTRRRRNPAKRDDDAGPARAART